LEAVELIVVHTKTSVHEICVSQRGGCQKYSPAFKMKAADPPTKLVVTYQNKQRHHPEDSNKYICL
jgi:hypothetical protein